MKVLISSRVVGRHVGLAERRGRRAGFGILEADLVLQVIRPERFWERTKGKDVKF